jgi:hypothetical protein
VRLEIFGSDTGDFVGKKLIWSALNGLAAAKRENPNEVDLRSLTLARPYTIAAIAAIGALTRGQCLLSLPQTQFSRDYVIRCGLTDFFRCPDATRLSRSPRTVTVRQVLKPDRNFAYEVSEVWEREFGGMPPRLRRDLADHLDEMLYNALAHSSSPIGCIVAAQAYPDAGTVELAVLDVGITIRGHLARNTLFSHISTDEQAILEATREGVTGTPPGTFNSLREPNSGIGLYELRNYCEHGGATAAILSGNSCVCFGSESIPMSNAFLGGFPGTLISIRFAVNRR